MAQTDTIVIGLDGATWSLLDPWIEEGALPNLRAMKERGAWGYNRSWLPPSTFPNWKCYATGKNPGKFGTYWFESVDVEAGRITVPDSNSFHSPELWDYLEEDGLRPAVLNMPTTYPPKSIDGYVVAGGPRSGDSGYTHPPEFEGILERDVGYRVHPRKAPINREDENEETIEEVLEVIDLRFDALDRVLAEGVDFVHLTIFYINVLQHFFGDAHCVKRGWERIDERLGELREDCDNLVLMSDHGSGDIHTVFWINTWLEQEGYLETKSGVTEELFSRLGEHRDSVLAAARTVGAETVLRQLTPEWLQMRVQPGGVHQKQSKDQLIDWDSSVAVASGQGPIYLNRSRLDDDEYESMRSELAAKLSDLRSPITGDSIAEDVHFRDDVYQGPYLEDAPDLVVEQRNGVHIDGGVGRSEVFEGPTKWQAENYRTGLFLFDSEVCRSGTKLGEIDIVDLASTLLHLMGHSVPEDLDGIVREEVFATGSEPAERAVEYREPLADREGVAAGVDQSDAKDRLEDLGYLS